MNLITYRAIKLPSGRVVGLRAYVSAFYKVRALPPTTEVRGWQARPVPATVVLSDYRRAIDNRINQRGAALA